MNELSTSRFEKITAKMDIFHQKIFNFEIVRKIWRFKNAHFCYKPKI